MKMKEIKFSILNFTAQDNVFFPGHLYQASPSQIIKDTNSEIETKF